MMGRTLRAIWIVGLCALLGACGKKTVQVSFDGSVPTNQQELIKDDFAALADRDLPYSTATDARNMNIANFKGATLASWFEARVKYFVGENFDAERNSTASARPGNLQPQILSTANQLFAASQGQVVTLAVNLGSQLYLEGKENSQLYTLQTQDTRFQVASPRVGLVQIGEGLFSAGIKGSPLNSLGNSFLRLAVLFHEARHSDGNGAKAGFPHEMCNSGDYAGNYACESNLNGPYPLQANLLRMFYSACTGCSSSELSAIQLDMTDYLGRLQQNAVFTDDRPEGLY